MHFFPTIKNSLKTSDPKQLTDIVFLFLNQVTLYSNATL